ncbi:type II toxin-antitoxin system Phd/YefM family antitoxin [Actimicrobium sp. CCI2.3]|uniref:type II toxin-antitoxin system Phd/YefM family antitoxin n=1 Tax=Actimicrobium sp. CCI2.3 TaxID=3048616 RepID=UPI002AB58BFF|nr:type II toxin-antitoxin system Phd/YefM family antitoxin [Actimicrobium sp. CCI2.3]MDY7575454.1 type II toxin-antitoxin system Phd/YefM family antitoxin [Actimicrobium sp. CCI2.3]MEB0021365.1 type II toxin-antitoxin system Phd/YefM family antitoxin [Actimicrobium sp. CCI2.3]
METKVGVKEFRARLPAYLDSSSPVTITRHGETIGYFVPARSGRKQAELAMLKDATATLAAMMTALEITENEIATEFAASRAADKR